MNDKKIFLLTFFLIFTLLFVSSCEGRDSKTVKEIPLGFIHLPKGGNLNNGLHYVSWESQISFLDDDVRQKGTYIFCQLFGENHNKNQYIIKKRALGFSQSTFNF